MTANSLGSGTAAGPTLWSAKDPTTGTFWQYGLWADSANNIRIWRRNRATNTFSHFDLSTIAGNPLGLPLDPTALGQEGHENPSLGVDAAGHIHVTCNNFLSNVPKMVRSNSPYDISAWTDIHTQFTSAPAGGQIAYFHFCPLASGNLMVMQRVRTITGVGNAPGAEYVYVLEGSNTGWTARGKLMGGAVNTEDAFYRNQQYCDKHGRVHLFGMWDRIQSGGTDAEKFSYLYTDDEGVTWHAIDGTPLVLGFNYTSASANAINTGVTLGRSGIDGELGYSLGCSVDRNGYPCGVMVDRVALDENIVRWTGTAWVADPAPGLKFAGGAGIQLLNFRGDLHVMARGRVAPNHWVDLRKVSDPNTRIAHLAGPYGNFYCPWPDPIILRDFDVIEIGSVDNNMVHPRVFAYGAGRKIVAA